MSWEDDAMKTTSTSEAKGRPTSATSGVLVAYFSWSGNTREIANQIHKIVGGHLFEIVSVDKYPSDYNQCVDQAKKELDADYLPKLVSDVEDIRSYDVVFIGYPNWWGTVPRPVASFLSRCNHHGKTIAPFCTHGGDRLGQSVEDILKICPQTAVLEGLAIRGGDARNAQNRVSEWLRKIGMVE